MAVATYQLTLPSITCISCVHSIESTLKQYKQDNSWLKEYAIDLTTKRLSINVEKQDSPDVNYAGAIANAIEEIGFRCIPLTLEDILFGKEHKDTDTGSNAWWIILRKFLLSHWFQGIIGTVCGISLLILSLVSGGLPLLTMLLIGVVSSLLTLWLGFPSYYDAFMKLWKAKTLTMDMLFTVSTLTVILVSSLAFFIPWLPMMFEAGLLVFGFRHVGLAIEESIKHKIEADKRFQHRLPRQVTIWVSDEQTEQCSLLNIQCGDLLIIQPGSVIPADGICVTDSNLIYETIKTGSPIPRVFKKGEGVISGMYLAEDARPLRLQVTASIKESYLARLDKTIEQAQHEKAPIEEVASRILQYFIPGVIAFAILSGVVIGLFFPPALAIQCAVSVLVSACPCTLGLVVPLAVKIGLQKAAEHGVEFKSAKKLQDAALIDAVVCDLHGTLTMGAPIVSHCECVSLEIDEQTMIAYAAAVEQTSKHPMAKAICNYAQARKVHALDKLESILVSSSNHSGIQGSSKGQNIIIGNERMMHDSAIDVTSIQERIILNAGENIVYIACNNVLLGYFILTDPLRNEAIQAIKALQTLGKQVHICTGADKKTAHRYAVLLGIPLANVAAGCVGMAEKTNDNAKINYIYSLQAKHLKVAMVGDADNDALALVKSDFGIAIKSNSSSEITQQQAGAVIQSPSLLPVANLFVIAKQTVSNIKQNLGFSLSYNTAALLMAGGLLALLGFTLNPGVGVALMILQTALILGNAYRFKAKSLDHLQPKTVDLELGGAESYQKLKLISRLEKNNPALDLAVTERRKLTNTAKGQRSSNCLSSPYVSRRAQEIPGVKAPCNALAPSDTLPDIGWRLDY